LGAGSNIGNLTNRRVLGAGSNTIGCPYNIVTTAAVVSQNIWPTQILAVLEVLDVVGFVIGGRAPFCSLFCAVLSLFLRSMYSFPFVM
jgi:hypothetical protein